MRPAPNLDGGDDHRPMLHWETLSFAPIDTRLIDLALFDDISRGWLNAYHKQVAEKIGPRLSQGAKLWLDAATAPI